MVECRFSGSTKQIGLRLQGASMLKVKRFFSFHFVSFETFLFLQDIRSLVEDRIYDKLNDKIDQCLDISKINDKVRFLFLFSTNFHLASYDWMMQESSGVASDYITTTIQFLENTFQAFNHLPVRQRVRSIFGRVFLLFAFVSFLNREK